MGHAPHRQARRSCALRPAWSHPTACRFPRPRPRRAQAVHHAHHPARPFAAGGALAAAFVLVEFGQRQIALIMSVDLSITITAAVPRPDPKLAQIIEIHDRIAHGLAAHTRHRTAARDHRQQIVPAAANAAAMLFDQLFEGIDIASSTTQGRFTWPEMANSLVPALLGRPKPANHAPATPQDRGHNGNGFHIVHRGRAAIKPRPRRKWRLHARHALAPFKAFQKRGFFAADIGARAVMQIEVEIPARFAGVRADQPAS
jgi:hypothetical protein